MKSSSSSFVIYWDINHLLPLGFVVLNFSPNCSNAIIVGILADVFISEAFFSYDKRSAYSKHFLSVWTSNKSKLKTGGQIFNVLAVVF